MKKTIQALLLIGLIAAPTLLFAQGVGPEVVTKGFSTLGGLVTSFTQTIVRSLATLFATAAMVAFFYGIVQYIWGIREGDQNKIKDGNKFMVWGLVALFVMFSVWGIINLAQRIFGIQGQNTIIIPSIELRNGASGPSNNPSAGLPSGAPSSSPCYSIQNPDRQAECLSGSSDSKSSECPAPNASCRASTGELGTCVYGNASRDYQLYCSPNPGAPSSSNQSQWNCFGRTYETEAAYLAACTELR